MKNKKIDLNTAIYKLHQFGVPYALTGGIGGSLIFCLFVTMLMFTISYLKGDIKGDFTEFLVILGVSLLLIIVIAGLCAAILFVVCAVWKSEKHIPKVVHTAKQFGYYYDDYLADIEKDLENGYNYHTAYLGLTDNFVFGILHNNRGSYVPVVIPRKIIVGVACDYSHTRNYVSGHMTTFYNGGYNMKLNNGKVPVIMYGHKFSMQKAVDKLSEAGYKVWREDKA